MTQTYSVRAPAPFTLPDVFPRLRLGNFPSPVREVPSPEGGQFWVKDDGLCSVIYAGNKVRKFEYLLADARRRGRTCLVVCGDAASHTVMGGGWLGRNAGFEVDAVVYPHDEEPTPSAELSKLEDAGVRLHHHRTLLACLGHARLLGLRRGSYTIPLGGTTPLATLGYVGAALELSAQVRDGRLPEPEKIFIAFATGGSVAGLLIGLALAGSPTRVVAVQTVDTVIANRRRLERLVRKTLAILPEQLRTGDCMARLDSIDGRFLGRGFRDVPPAALAAVRVARSCGLVLEPVFTGKAMAALLQEMRERRGQKLLFWNTHDQQDAHQTE